MKVTVVGAGNMGLAMTAYMTIFHKADVTLFTNKDIDFIYLNIVEQKITEETNQFLTTNDPVEAFTDADYVFVTYPGFLRKKFVNEYGDFINKSGNLGFVPGYGGSEYFCKELIAQGITVFGLQRVPYVARANGCEASILSSKRELYVSSIPVNRIEKISKVVAELLDIKTVAIKDYLAITLTPTNPIIHIAGLWGAFKDYDPQIGYVGKVGFYDQWDNLTSRLLFDYDSEVQNICSKLNMFDLSSVISLPVYYESDTPARLTEKLKSIESFKVVKVPLKTDDDKLVVDLNNRMFIEDFPFGVVVYKDIANILEIETPIIDMILRFYERLSGVKYDFITNKSTLSETGAPSANGLATYEKFIDFYKREGE